MARGKWVVGSTWFCQGRAGHVYLWQWMIPACLGRPAFGQGELPYCTRASMVVWCRAIDVTLLLQDLHCLLVPGTRFSRHRQSSPYGGGVISSRVRAGRWTESMLCAVSVMPVASLCCRDWICFVCAWSDACALSGVTASGSAAVPCIIGELDWRAN